MLVGTAVLLLVAVLTGGRLQRIGAVGFRSNWLLLAAIGTQIAILETPLSRAPEAVLSIVHIATYAVAGTWVLRNHRVPGLVVLGVGGLLNFLAITTNGGVMPAYPQAIATAGIQADPGFSNSAASTRSMLWFFGDIFAIPRGLPFANVFSLGDILILVGAGVFLMTTTRDHRLDAVAPDDAAAPVTAVAPGAGLDTGLDPAHDDGLGDESPSREATLQALVAHLAREVATLEAAAAAAHPAAARSDDSGQRVQPHPEQVQQRDRGELPDPLAVPW